MKAFYQKIDHMMLEKYPTLWVLGVHIYLPILALLYLVLFAFGILYPMNPLPYWNDYRKAFENINLTMILPIILLTVMFVIRQVKFNSKRVHLSLPYKNSFLVFLYFLSVLFLITAAPFVPNFAGYFKSHATLDIEEFEEDVKILEKGFVHFFLDKQYIDILSKNFDKEKYYNELPQSDHYDEYGRDQHIIKYKLNQTKDSLILYRHFVRYYYGNDLDTISLEQAYQEIDDFIRVSSKYEGEVTLTNPQSIVQQNLASRKYYLKDEKSHKPAFDYLVSYSRFDNNIEFHDNLQDESSIFFVIDIDFWRLYFFISLAISALLIILCSVKIAEFGWGMLVVALLPTVYGIFMALGAYTLRNAGNDSVTIYGLVLILIFIAITAFISFSNYFKPALKRAFAVALHIYLPITVIAIITFWEEIKDCCFADSTYHCDCVLPLTRSDYQSLLISVFILSALLVTYLFGRYYKKQYVNPQKA